MPQPDPSSRRPSRHTRRATHPNSDIRGTERPGDSRARRRAAEASAPTRPAVPISVWVPSATVDPDEAWPAPILEQIIATLSAPGQAVALLTDQPASQDPPGPAYGTAARALVPPGTLAAARELLDAHDRRARLAHFQTHGDDAAEPFWARFVHPNEGASPDGDVTPLAPRSNATPGRPAEAIEPTEPVALVIAAVDPTGVGDAFGIAAADLLRDGGTLAVITHCDHRDGRLVDPSGSLVASAQNADLLYLQHIVALHHPLTSGCLTRSRPAATGTAERHRRVHSDVYLFAWHGQTAAALSQARAA